LRTKISFYLRGLEGFPLASVLVITDRTTRMESLARAAHAGRHLLLFTTIDLVRERGIIAPVFYRSPEEREVALV
jgi:hypothetical protein